MSFELELIERLRRGEVGIIEAHKEAVEFFDGAIPGKLLNQLGEYGLVVGDLAEPEWKDEPLVEEVDMSGAELPLEVRIDPAVEEMTGSSPDVDVDLGLVQDEPIVVFHDVEQPMAVEDMAAPVSEPIEEGSAD
jgi:hypothetical protein